MVIRSAELLDGKKSGSVKKKILVLVDWYEPGFKAGGPIQACKNVVTSLKGVMNFLFFVQTGTLVTGLLMKAYP